MTIIDEGRNNVVLLIGYPKVGNTWTMYVIANYFNILNFGANKTLQQYEVFKILRSNPPTKWTEGFPSLHHTHVSSRIIKKNGLFDKFDKFVYIYRNPFDAMISLYNWRTNQTPPFKGIYNDNPKLLEKIMKLNGFIEERSKPYINHVRKNIRKADLVLYYDNLRKDPNGFKSLLRLLVNKIDENVFKKAIGLSSFDNIKRNVEQPREEYENKKGNYYFQKTRDGRIDQYKNILSKEQILFIKKMWNKARLGGYLNV